MASVGVDEAKEVYRDEEERVVGEDEEEGGEVAA
jgi:hypothetical protein